jgi:UDP-3-O-[3-hydroxymyristoyl] N-acetylglucosamine deacetylase
VQTTIRRPVRFSHLGLLTNRVAGVRLGPGPPDSGIVFNGTIPARLAHAFIERHLVGLRKGRETVLGVEHLLAACYGLGIDNLQVEVNGGEIPFGDGSALPFVRILQAAGRRHDRAARLVQSLRRPVIVRQGGSFICALPLRSGATARARLNVNCFIHFPEKVVGAQFFGGCISANSFRRELASARTFGLRESRLRLPVWLKPVCRIKDGIVVPVRPRFADEQVRHKTLDLLGDLALLGCRLQAQIFAYKTGHRLHHEFLRRVGAGSHLEGLWM